MYRMATEAKGKFIQKTTFKVKKKIIRNRDSSHLSKDHNLLHYPDMNNLDVQIYLTPSSPPLAATFLTLWDSQVF